MAQGFRHLAGASVPRTAALVAGVLVIEMAFIFSYVGAISHPYPHEVPIGIVAPASTRQTLIRQIQGRGDQFAPTAYPSSASALRAVTDHTIDAFVVARGGTVAVFVSGAPSPVVATAVRTAVAPIGKALGRPIAVHTVVPLPAQDPEGLGPFYLVVGWVVGGYLAASVVGLARGTDPGLRSASFRAAAFAAFAAASAVAGTLLVGPGMQLFGGSRGDLVGIGTLVVFATAIVATAFQALIGELGIALAVVLFVVVGNPSSGGPYPREFLSGVWRAVGGDIPTGAGLDGVRNVAYFGSHGLGPSLLVLGIYAVAGTAVVMVAGVRHDRARRHRSAWRSVLR